MKAVMFGLALVLAMGCGKKEEAEFSPKPEPKSTEKKPVTVLWEFETGSDVVFSLAIGSDGTVYIGIDYKKLYAINGKSGFKLWEFETGSSVGSSPRRF